MSKSSAEPMINSKNGYILRIPRSEVDNILTDPVIIDLCNQHNCFTHLLNKVEFDKDADGNAIEMCFIEVGGATTTTNTTSSSSMNNKKQSDNSKSKSNQNSLNESFLSSRRFDSSFTRKEATAAAAAATTTRQHQQNYLISDSIENLGTLSTDIQLSFTDESLEPNGDLVNSVYSVEVDNVWLDDKPPPSSPLSISSSSATSTTLGQKSSCNLHYDILSNSEFNEQSAIIQNTPVMSKAKETLCEDNKQNCPNKTEHVVNSSQIATIVVNQNGVPPAPIRKKKENRSPPASSSSLPQQSPVNMKMALKEASKDCCNNMEKENVKNSKITATTSSVAADGAVVATAGATISHSTNPVATAAATASAANTVTTAHATHNHHHHHHHSKNPNDFQVNRLDYNANDDEAAEEVGDPIKVLTHHFVNMLVRYIRHECTQSKELPRNRNTIQSIHWKDEDNIVKSMSFYCVKCHCYLNELRQCQCSQKTKETKELQLGAAKLIRVIKELCGTEENNVDNNGEEEEEEEEEEEMEDENDYSRRLSGECASEYYYRQNVVTNERTVDSYQQISYSTMSTGNFNEELLWDNFLCPPTTTVTTATTTKRLSLTNLQTASTTAVIKYPSAKQSTSSERNKKINNNPITTTDNSSTAAAVVAATAAAAAAALDQSIVNRKSMKKSSSNLPPIHHHHDHHHSHHDHHQERFTPIEQEENNDIHQRRRKMERGSFRRRTRSLSHKLHKWKNEFSQEFMKKMPKLSRIL